MALILGAGCRVSNGLEGPCPSGLKLTSRAQSLPRISTEHTTFLFCICSGGSRGVRSCLGMPAGDGPRASPRESPLRESQRSDKVVAANARWVDSTYVSAALSCRKPSLRFNWLGMDVAGQEGAGLRSALKLALRMVTSVFRQHDIPPRLWAAWGVPTFSLPSCNNLRCKLKATADIEACCEQRT
jgi:hypothetical protein